MDAVTLSPKYQIAIPRAVRQLARIKPDETTQFLSSEDRIDLVRTRAIRKTRGFFPGMDAPSIPDQGEHVFELSGVYRAARAA